MMNSENDEGAVRSFPISSSNKLKIIVSTTTNQLDTLLSFLTVLGRGWEGRGPERVKSHQICRT